MGRPSKSTDVLKQEGKSHRTKAELEKRSEGEVASLTGHPMSEFREVKRNKIAHKEFSRVSKLLTAVGKNDSLYEAAINRYCLTYADTVAFAELKEQFSNSKDELMAEYENNRGTGNEITPSNYYRMLTKMQDNILAIDKRIESKQKALFDIEKEFAMTLSAAMRSIPKAPEQKSNPLLEALSDED